MKNFLLIFLVATATLFSGCSKDEDDVVKSVTNDLLIGTWQFDRDPGYGDPTFFNNGRVEMKYFKAAWNDDFTETGKWVKNGNNLIITWDDADPGLEIYNTNVIELSEQKLKWEVMIDGRLTQEIFTRK